MSKELLVRAEPGRRGFVKMVGMLGLTPWLSAKAMAAVEDSSLQWSIKEAKVVSAGREVEMAEGIMLQDLVIEGKALALNTEFMSAADFQLMLQAFSPAKDMGKQLAGHWYLKGVWVLNDPLTTNAPVSRQWNRPGVLKSQFLAETEHDPRLASSHWRADFSMLPGRFTPMDAKASAFPLRGQGALAMNAGFEGTLSLALR